MKYVTIAFFVLIRHQMMVELISLINYDLFIYLFLRVVLSVLAFIQNHYSTVFYFLLFSRRYFCAPYLLYT